MADAAGEGQANKATFKVPNAAVGRIIGRGGQTIMSLQQSMQIHIQIEQLTIDDCRNVVVTSTDPKETFNQIHEWLVALDAGEIVWVEHLEAPAIGDSQPQRR
eukprot:m.254475 g.254475  ORF g.254475 m.254475 type:complete len:103 (-) comp15940_c0_seq3:178-486(-)